jgi:hypothetical protein
MYFCSHCGFLQPPNAKTCPRCGVAVTPDGGSESQGADDDTIISALVVEAICYHRPCSRR